MHPSFTGKKEVALRVLDNGGTWSTVTLLLPLAVVSIPITSANRTAEFFADSVAAENFDIQLPVRPGKLVSLKSTLPEDKEAVDRLIHQEESIPITLHFVRPDGSKICDVPITNKQMSPYASYWSFSPYSIRQLRDGHVPPRQTLEVAEKIAKLSAICGENPREFEQKNGDLFKPAVAPATFVQSDTPSPLIEPHQSVSERISFGAKHSRSS